MERRPSSSVIDEYVALETERLRAAQSSAASETSNAWRRRSSTRGRRRTPRTGRWPSEASVVSVFTQHFGPCDTRKHHINGRILEFDYINHAHKVVGEADGYQHIAEVEYFVGKNPYGSGSSRTHPKTLRQINNDADKRDWAQKHGFTFVSVPSWDPGNPKRSLPKGELKRATYDRIVDAFKKTLKRRLQEVVHATRSSSANLLNACINEHTSLEAVGLDATFVSDVRALVAPEHIQAIVAECALHTQSRITQLERVVAAAEAAAAAATALRRTHNAEATFGRQAEIALLSNDLDSDTLRSMIHGGPIGNV